jgi:hypothetical protein
MVISRVDDLFDWIEVQRRDHWRSPLFIVGAGVSSDRVPLMSEIFSHFVNCTQSTSLQNEKIKIINEYATRLRESTRADTKATAAHFFGLLQNSMEPEISSLWDKFTSKFFGGELRENSIAMWELDPTDFHIKIAEQIVNRSLPGFCISLNYDGLTAKALIQVASEKIWRNSDCLYPCRVLSTPDEIDSFWRRNLTPQNSVQYPVIKMKGDIFYAICQNEGCKFHAIQTPIYEFFLGRRKRSGEQSGAAGSMGQKEEKGKQVDLLTQKQMLVSYDEAIKCEECLCPRRIEIDFPGYRAKEYHSRQVLIKVCTYILPSLSCVVLCGVSGDWDDEIHHFLEICAIHKGIPIFCLSNKPAPDILRHLPWALTRKVGSREANFRSINIDFSKFRIPGN